jgi:hypothetical protein
VAGISVINDKNSPRPRWSNETEQLPVTGSLSMNDDKSEPWPGQGEKLRRLLRPVSDLNQGDVFLELHHVFEVRFISLGWTTI